MKVARYIETLSPYVPGKPIEEVEREYGAARVLKLASNENVLGPSPKALVAARAALERIHLYPDGGAYELKRAIARHFQVTPEEVMVGNGSNDLIELLIEAFLADGEEAVTSEHTFPIYKLAIQAQGRRCHFAPMTPELRYDLDAILARVTPATRLVFLANPDNPTGTFFTRDELLRFLKALPREVLVVMDEAYFEFAVAPDYPNALDHRAEHPNLVVLRTCSKIYGMAGLRLGYGFASPEVVDYVNRVRPPFNVSSVAQAAGIAALGDDEHVRRSRELARAELPFVTAGLERIGARVLPSQTNFVLADFPGIPAQKLFTALLEKGVVVRPMTGYGFPTAQRINIATREDDERMLAAVTDSVAALRAG